MSGRGLWVAIGLALLVGPGCASGRGPLTILSFMDVERDDYLDVLERWTREERLYDLLYARLFVSATFHSPEFRRAFLLRHHHVYGSGSEEARRLSLTDEGAGEAHEFFFAAFTPNAKTNDFDRDDSIWRVTLVGSEGQRVDGKVIRLKTTANLRVIYPYISDFARTYAVRFPLTDPNGTPMIGPSSSGFSLHLTSALGEAVLTWELEPTGSGGVASR